MLRQGQRIKPAAAAQADAADGRMGGCAVAAAPIFETHSDCDNREGGVVTPIRPCFLSGEKGVLVLMRRRYTGFSSDSVAWDSNELVLNFTLGVRTTEMLQNTLNFLEIPLKNIKLLACVVHMVRAGTTKG